MRKDSRPKSYRKGEQPELIDNNKDQEQKVKVIIDNQKQRKKKIKYLIKQKDQLDNYNT